MKFNETFLKSVTRDDMVLREAIYKLIFKIDRNRMSSYNTE